MLRIDLPMNLSENILRVLYEELNSLPASHKRVSYVQLAVAEPAGRITEVAEGEYKKKSDCALPADLQQTVMVRPKSVWCIAHVAVRYDFIYLPLSSSRLPRNYQEDLLDVTFNFKTLIPFREK